MTSLPFSQACENNKTFILDILHRHLQQPSSVLEIGSGTGQHAEYFASHLPHLTWQATELAENIPLLDSRLKLATLPNLPEVLALDVTRGEWPSKKVGNIFSANTLHIMGAPAVRLFFEGVARHLEPGGLLLVYGPFKYQGEYTSDSNASFDSWLKARDPVSGIRDFEVVNGYAITGGLELLEDNAMPANNQMLVWRKQ
ncbi:MAG: DUF938 domain-containing protein [Gammaproteobacteria bacterium]